MAKFCEKCGAEVDATSKFCAKCGVKLEDGIDPSASEPQVKESAQPVKKKRSLFKTLGTIFFVMAVLSSVIHGCGGQSSSSKTGGSANSDKVIQVKADDMIKEYQEDLTAADKKYKDKKIEITGQLLSKQQFSNTQNYGLMIYHTKVGNKQYDVMVDVDKDKVEEANKVKAGDFVKVSGVCVGRVAQDTPEYISVQVKAKKIND